MSINHVSIPANLLPGDEHSQIDPDTDPGMLMLWAIRRDFRKRGLPVQVSATYGRATEVAYHGESRFRSEAMTVVRAHMNAR